MRKLILITSRKPTQAELDSRKYSHNGRDFEFSYPVIFQVKTEQGLENITYLSPTEELTASKNTGGSEDGISIVTVNREDLNITNDSSEDNKKEAIIQYLLNQGAVNDEKIIVEIKGEQIRDGGSLDEINFDIASSDWESEDEASFLQLLKDMWETNAVYVSNFSNDNGRIRAHVESLSFDSTKMDGKNITHVRKYDFPTEILNLEYNPNLVEVSADIPSSNLQYISLHGSTENLDWDIIRPWLLNLPDRTSWFDATFKTTSSSSLDGDIHIIPQDIYDSLVAKNWRVNPAAMMT